jgi:hypothetical protein
MHKICSWYWLGLIVLIGVNCYEIYNKKESYKIENIQFLFHLQNII